MSLLKAPVVKNSHILAAVYFNFLQRCAELKTWKCFNFEFGPQWKDWKSIYEVRENIEHFRNLAALILDWKFVKCLIVANTLEKSSLKLPGAS